jgi:integrase
MFKRTRYQAGCLTSEKRKAGPDVWIFRWRDGHKANRKMVVGTFQRYRTKAAAMKAVEVKRIEINKESWHPTTVQQLTEHYEQTELLRKTPYTQEVYRGYLQKWILPEWGGALLSDVHPVPVEEWLKTCQLANGTRAKLRNLMSALYRHAMRHEWTDRNPITLVRQSAKRSRFPEVLGAAEIQALLAELKDPYRTMVFVAACTGLRVSELLALKWSDLNFASEEISLRRGIVRQNIGEMKTEASQKPIPLDAGLAAVLMEWRGCCAYNQPEDWIFASPDMHGSQPYWPNSAMEKNIRPAALRAGISKRIGWHTFRHSYATLLKANGEDVKTV